MLSEDGLTLGVSVAVSYRLNQEMLGYLQRDIGADYFDRMIRPQVESHAGGSSVRARPTRSTQAPERSCMG